MVVEQGFEAGDGPVLVVAGGGACTWQVPIPAKGASDRRPGVRGSLNRRSPHARHQPSTGARALRVGSLFSGYGGLDLAVEHVFNTETVWFSDLNEPVARVFAHHLARRTEPWRHHHHRADESRARCRSAAHCLHIVRTLVTKTE